MRGKIKADGFRFKFELFKFRPVRLVRQFDLGVQLLVAEQGGLLAGFKFGRRSNVTHDGFDIGKQAAAVLFQTVESAGLNQLLQLTAVNLLDIGPMNEIGNVLIRTVRLAFGDNCPHIGLADAFDRAQSIADIAVFDHKVGTGMVDVGF